MAAVTIELDSSHLAAFKGDKLPKALTNAVRKAGSEALKALKASSQKYVRQRKRLKVSRVNKALPTKKAKGRRLEDLAWRMDVSGRPIKLAEYPHRQVKRGVSVSVNKGKRSLVPGAFVATMKSGHTGVFVRRGAARLPIQELYSSTVEQVFRDHGMVYDQMERAKFVFGRAVRRLLPLELAKAGK